MAIKETSLVNAAISNQLLSNEQVAQARAIARREHLGLLDVLCRDHRMPVTAFYQAAAMLRDLDFFTLSELQPATDILHKLPVNLVVRRQLLPVIGKDNGLYLALADPDDQIAVDAVRRVVNQQVQVVLAEPISISSVLRRFVPNAMLEEESDPVVLFDALMKDAYVRRASDIHLEPLRDGMQVRMRVDGDLLPYPKLLSLSETHQMVNRIKVLAQLDIAEQRLPQDGAFSYAISDWSLSSTDLRVATLPARWGERVTIRILGQEEYALSLSQLGMTADTLAAFHKVLSSPHGMVLVTGPTGSGKSTTLYAALRALDRHKFNILTVEDPIEQVLEHITQVQVSIKTNFSLALRAFLRHDPDIILVGEIRDHDTAETALKAAMTGHLVLSTLHTNDAVSAIERMVNIGCDPFLVSTTVRMVIAQRLVRRLCQKCRQPLEEDDKARDLMTLNPGARYYQAHGCAFCVGTGYSGRIGIYEIFHLDDAMIRLINQGKSSHQLRQVAGNALHSLWRDAQLKAAAGETDIAEILAFRDLTTVQDMTAGSAVQSVVETVFDTVAEVNDVHL